MIAMFMFFSSPEPEAQVSFSDQNLSVVVIVVVVVVVVGVDETFHIFIFSRTTGLISTKVGTEHPRVKGIQVCSNEGHRPFPKGDNYEKANIH